MNLSSGTVRNRDWPSIERSCFDTESASNRKSMSLQRLTYAWQQFAESRMKLLILACSVRNWRLVSAASKEFVGWAYESAIGLPLSKASGCWKASARIVYVSKSVQRGS